MPDAPAAAARSRADTATTRPVGGVNIGWWALGYFVAYAPYSALTKALSDGRLGARVTGNAILPLSTLASLLAMVTFLLATGW